jgi:hypothetical protein
MLRSTPELPPPLPLQPAQDDAATGEDNTALAAIALALTPGMLAANRVRPDSAGQSPEGSHGKRWAKHSPRAPAPADSYPICRSSTSCMKHPVRMRTGSLCQSELPKFVSNT